MPSHNSERNNPWPLLLTLLFSALCLLPAMLLRDFTPANELRYLSIADEAIANGHVFAFYNHGIAYADKPPLYLWIVMLCRLVAGKHCCWLLSLFSLLPALGIVAVMDKWVMRGTSSLGRAATALILLTCIMFLGTAVVLRMDMLMCLFIVLALYTFDRMYSLREAGQASCAEYRRYSWLLPLWIFMALFTKGPVGLLVPPLSIAVFLVVRRKWREIGKYLGWKTWGVLLGLAVLWFIGVYCDGGKSYLDNLLFKQTMGRAVNAFTHSRPFWFYFATVWWCIAPYCLLLIGALVVSLIPSSKLKSADGHEAGKASDTEVLFVCVIVSTLVMLSSFSSKLPIYLVPAFPFIVYLFPMLCRRIGERRWMRWALGIPALVLAAAGIALTLGLGGIVRIEALEELLSEYPFARSPIVLACAVILAVGYSAAVCLSACKRKSTYMSALFMGATLLAAIFCGSFVLPEANPYVGYGAVCKEIPEDAEVVTVFLKRPENMDVYLGRQIVDLGKDVDSLAATLDGRVGKGDNPVAIVTYESRVERTPQLKAVFGDGEDVIRTGPYAVKLIR